MSNEKRIEELQLQIKDLIKKKYRVRQMEIPYRILKMHKDAEKPMRVTCDAEKIVPILRNAFREMDEITEEIRSANREIDEIKNSELPPC